ncbi:hypothetical protein AX17_004286 [Amanita inopinata Kibby_2008]|nr:hypothetical protein AX17_004286 [Amanita inopinata Kibby_2008]
MSSLSRCNVAGAVFPINRLPPEVMARVFKHCLPEPGEVEENPNDVAPLLLGRVRSSWQALAYSTPELWSTLNLYIGRGGRNVRHFTGFITAWLEKSGKLPLNIHLFVPISEKLLDSILECLYRYRSRWEILSIVLLTRIPLPPMGDLPLLQSFRYTEWLSGGHLDLPFASAPRLTELEWTYGRRVVGHSGVPWHQLTRLSFGKGITSDDAIEAIQNCPELLYFSASVNGDEMERTRSLPGHQVELRKLRMLFINMNSDCSPLLRSLTLPELAVFTLSIDHRRGQWPENFVLRRIHRELLRLFTRSKCKLDRLYLHDCGFDETMALECFRHNSLSTLTELYVEGRSYPLIFTDQVILELTLTEVGLLPKLSHLSLYHDGATSPGLLGRMVLSRRRSSDDAAGQLKSISLVTPSLDDDDGTYIDMASDLGLEADVDIV